MAWFVSYQHSVRPNGAGVKLVGNEQAAAAAKQDLELHGYVVTKVAPNPYLAAPLTTKSSS